MYQVGINKGIILRCTVHQISRFYQVVCFIQLSEARVLSVSLKMDNIEYRAVIRVLLSCPRTHSMLSSEGERRTDAHLAFWEFKHRRK